MYYAGIGSRRTPREVLEVFRIIGRYLASIGYVLRSGRADGADSAFELGARDYHGSCEIYLPWPSFQANTWLGRNYPGIVLDSIEPAQRELAYKSVQQFHPAPERLSQGAMKLQARDYCQITGKSTKACKSEFVVCWTDRQTGGTSQAIRVAQSFGIPVFNFYYAEDRNAFLRRFNGETN